MNRLESITAELGAKVSARSRSSSAATGAWSRPESPSNPPAPRGRPVAARPVETTEVAARRLARGVQGDLAENGVRLYELLLWLALEVAVARNYAAGRWHLVSQVSFHLPAELLELNLGISRPTRIEHLKRLRALGLVDWRAHKTTHRGCSRNDGSVWSIKLNPHRGKSARLTYDQLKTEYRNLSDDIEAGRTVYQLKQQIKEGGLQSIEDLRTVVGKEVLKDWALTPDLKSPATSMTVNPGRSASLTQVLDLPGMPKKARAPVINDIAHYCARHLGDTVNFQRWLLWQMCRLADQGQNYANVVYEALSEVLADTHDPGRGVPLNRPGAVLVAELRNRGIYDELQRVSKTRGATGKHRRVGMSA